MFRAIKYETCHLITITSRPQSVLTHDFFIPCPEVFNTLASLSSFSILQLKDFAPLFLRLVLHTFQVLGLF